ncbi:hypothetical protein [Nonomuraea fuscirosea]|uniref:hypothetical protein n=1 Tax=Nonomuraea fuscirosea TaxID=1291556 RepID=UPI0033D90EA4
MNDRNTYDLVAQIARHLTGFAPQSLRGALYLLGPDGARLAVHPLMGRAEWIVVTGLYPADSSGLRRHSVIAKTTRGPRHIAKKIARRLLPKYTRDLRQLQAKFAGRDERADLVATLSAFLPDDTIAATEQQTVIRWQLGSMSGFFKVRDHATSIEIDNADRELAERVAYAINQRST